jgi:hypothetical protein
MTNSTVCVLEEVPAIKEVFRDGFHFLISHSLYGAHANRKEMLRLVSAGDPYATMRAKEVLVYARTKSICLHIFHSAFQ